MNNPRIFKKFDRLAKPERCINTNCDRCAGTGFVPPFGVCFKCEGVATMRSAEYGFPTSWSDEECAKWEQAREDRNRKARERAEAKRLAKWKVEQAERAEREEQNQIDMVALADEKWAENVEECPILQEVWDSNKVDFMCDFVRSIVDQAHVYNLTDRQISAFERVASKELRRV